MKLTIYWRDPSKAKKKLNWNPELDFKGLVKTMVESDLELAEKEKCTLLKITYFNQAGSMQFQFNYF